MKIIKSSLLTQFHCIAQNCPDSCCKEWEVQVDSLSATKYRAIPGALGDRLRQVLQDVDGEAVMSIENGRCPMWRTDGLCQIQFELGEDALCKVCREFPRLTHDYGDFIEIGLELSCPEAARLILTSPPAPPIVTEQIGGSLPDYEPEAMTILQHTRKKALALLDDTQYSHSEALALLLMYAHHAQACLDGLEISQFHPQNALKHAKELEKPADITAFLNFFKGLEILTNVWRVRLVNPSPTPWCAPLRALARYGVDRYWLQAVSDYDLISRVKMIILSCLLVKILGGDPVSVAQLYSKEIENNIDNVEAILDAAYTHPVFTDDKLLWLINQP